MGDIEATGAVEHQSQQECAHPVTSSSLIAGMRRIVCEVCGHVSVEYVSSTVRLFTDDEYDEYVVDLSAGDRTSKREPRKCFRCRGKALFITPVGLGCTAHAWEAAAEQEAMGRDLWIPIRIEL